MALEQTRSEYCQVTVKLKGGSQHEFPDMSENEVTKVLRFLGSDVTTLSMVNIHGACLTMPMRVVQSIVVNGRVLWTFLDSSSNPNP